MDKPKTTPRDFFLWAGAMITLYGSIIALMNLFSGYINYAFPDTLNYYSYQNPYDSGMSYWMSMFIILSIAAIGLLRFIHRTIEKDPSRAEIWIRRWALHLTIFIAGVTILGDLIALLHTFLSGSDLTTRFLLKVAVVFLVSGGAFLHFLADLRGYWAAEPRRANLMTIAVSLVGILTIVSGFFIIGTPQQARQYRLDDQKINDLQNIQWQVVNYWQQKQKLPAKLSDLSDPISGITIPTDPQTGEPYEYKATGAMTFDLCATFNLPSRDNTSYVKGRVMVVGVPVGSDYAASQNDTWQHEGGKQTCFSRTIDPDRYPPIKK